MAFEDCCCPVVGEFVVISGWDPQRTRVVDGVSRTEPHKGIDLIYSGGATEIYAIADGTVRSFAYEEEGAGYHISLYHRGLDNGVGMSKYFHLVEGSTPENLKKTGTEVKKGDFLGHMGNTGNADGIHLHFELRTKRNKAIDPTEFINQTSEYIDNWTTADNKIRIRRNGRNPDVEQQNALPSTQPQADAPPPAPTTPQQNINRSNVSKTGIKKPEKKDVDIQRITDEELKASLIGFYMPQLIKGRGTYYEHNIIRLLSDEKTPYASNMIFRKSKENLDFSLLNNAEISSLVPYIEMYAIQKKGREHKYVQYPFDDYTNKIKLDNILADKTGRGGNVGIQSLDWKTIATNQSNVNQIMVSIKIIIQDIQEIEQTRNGISLLDFLYPAGTRSNEYDDDNFNVKLKLGWLYKKENNEALNDLDRKVNEKELSETLLVSLYKHSFEFDKSGAVILDLQYIGMIETQISNVNKLDILSALNPEQRKQKEKVDSAKEIIDILTNPSTEIYNILSKKYKAREDLGIELVRIFNNDNAAQLVINTKRYRIIKDIQKQVIDKDGIDDALKEIKKILTKSEKELKRSYLPGLSNLLQTIPKYPLIITKEQKQILKEISTLDTRLLSGQEYQKLQTYVSKAILKSKKINPLSDSTVINELFSSEDKALLEGAVILVKKGINAFLDAQAAAGRFVGTSSTTKFRYREGLRESAVSTTSINVNGKILEKELLEGVIRTNKDVGEAVAFVYLGDILNYYMELFYNTGFHNSDSAEPLTLVVGQFSYRDIGDLVIDTGNTGNQTIIKSDTLFFSDGTPYIKRGLERKYASLLDIPVSIESVTNWYNTHILDSSLEKMSFFSFIRSLFANIVPANLTNQILDYGSKRIIQPSFNFLTIKNDNQDAIDKELREAVKVNVAKLKNSNYISNMPVLEIFLNEKSNFNAFKRFAATPNETNIPIRNYMFIFSMWEKTKLFSDYRKDLENGIHHLYVAEETGLVEEIKFLKEDNPALDAANLIKANDNDTSKSIIRQVYQSEINMFGNTIFTPGQLVHISPTYPGSRLKNKTLYKIGLGGYYRIIEIQNFIQDGKFQTKLKTKWEMHGEDIKEDQTFDGFVRVEIGESQTVQSGVAAGVPQIDPQVASQLPFQQREISPGRNAAVIGANKR